MKAKIVYGSLRAMLMSAVQFASRNYKRPILRCVNIAAKDGKVTVRATDSNSLIESSCEAKVEDEGMANVDFSAIKKSLSAFEAMMKAKSNADFRAGECELSIETHEAIIDQDGIRFSIGLCDPGSYPVSDSIFPAFKEGDGSLRLRLAPDSLRKIADACDHAGANVATLFVRDGCGTSNLKPVYFELGGPSGAAPSKVITVPVRPVRVG